MSEDAKGSFVGEDFVEVVNGWNESKLGQEKDVLDDGNFDHSTKILTSSLFEYEDLHSSSQFVRVKFDGTFYKVPFVIRCHLCSDLMKLCLRKTKYQGEPREYVAYRCNHKGCQTFRSVKKVFSHGNSPEQDDFNEYDGRTDDFKIHSLGIPDVDEQNQTMFASQLCKPLTTKTHTYKGFHDKLKETIMANREFASTRRGQTSKGSTSQSQQGTLIYLTKTLTAREIIDVENAIAIALTKKGKSPLKDVKDLPIFSHCPFSHEYVQNEIYTQEKMENLAVAISSSPQPPLPAGYYFDRENNNRLMYKRGLYSDCNDPSEGMIVIGDADEDEDPVMKKSKVTPFSYNGSDDSDDKRVDRKALVHNYMRKRETSSSLNGNMSHSIQSPIPLCTQEEEKVIP